MRRERLISLDVVRGLTVAGMIMVNNGYGETFGMLRHAEWNGLSVSDFVFPFFLFVVGVSIYLSLEKYGFRVSGNILVKILKRSILLFAIGIGINWLGSAVWGDISIESLRFWAVLQRISLCYLVVSLFALCGVPRLSIPLVVLLLATYTWILVNGDGYSEIPDRNILYRVDAAMLGESHLYRWLPIDPEGIVGTVGAVVNTLLGFYCAFIFGRRSGISDRIISVFRFGTILIILGFLLHFYLPYNKNIWSPSFALVTSGSCSLLLAMVMNSVDRERRVGICMNFFIVFGSNALLLYVTSQLMAIIFGRIGFSDMIYSGVSSLIPMAEFASLAYAMSYVLMNFVIGYPLWRKRIYIKL